MADLSRFRGCLLGLATGDALGTTVEFRRRGTFAPLVDIVGGGPFGLSPGEWTDDTSMALCLAESFVEMGMFDATDQMDRYSRWRNDGYLSCNGRCFDIGRTVAAALERYRQTGDAFAGSADPRSAGNGCIMRLAPVPMFYFPDEAAAKWYSGESSRTTAAVCGQLAGAFYGERGIPSRWLAMLAMRNEIGSFAERLCKAGSKRSQQGGTATFEDRQ
jgi:ADP-ribosyl-[dinitrogen reductase] hydrolase